MENSKNFTEEFKKFNYLLDDESWKDALPGFTLYASSVTPKNPKVSVIIANYNNGPYLERMMDSLMEQTLGIHRLQVMFIDDRSTDNSLEIVKPYTDKYPNVEIYHLDKNTGGAHGPRNVGLLNARGEYLVFLDADDWYAPDGLKVLADLLDESGDGIAFGGIMRSINGQLFRGDPSYIELDKMNRPISDLPYDFYSWLGPQANMVRASIVFDNNLHFIDQRVADDVTFFIQVLRLSGSISQTSQLTTYLNRDDDNASLSKSVNETFMTSWLRALSYLKNTYTMDISLERFMARRLEWLVIDFVLRWDTGYGFSKEKVTHFADLVHEYLGDLPFDATQYFKTDARRIVWKAIQERDFDFLVKFYEWHSLPFYDKKLELRDGHYFHVPDDPSLPAAEINTRIEGNYVDANEDEIIVNFDIYTNETINYCELRSLHNPWLNQILDVDKVGEWTYQVVITRAIYDELEDDAYNVYIRTNNYHDNPILINDVERFTAPDTVIRNIDNSVAIEKRSVEKGNFLVIRELSSEDITPSNGVKSPKWISVIGASFLENGHFARETDDNLRITAVEDYVTPINLENETIEKVVAKNNTLIGTYIANTELPIYTTPKIDEAEKFENSIAKSEVFNVTNVVFGEEDQLFLEIGYGKYVSADATLAKRIKLDEQFYTLPGMYQVNKQKLPIFKNPSYESEVIMELPYHTWFLAENVIFDNKQESLLFRTENGYVSAEQTGLVREGEVADDGYYHTGKNFIVISDCVSVYEDIDMKKLATFSKINKGMMFAIDNFSMSRTGEYSMFIDKVGYISAKKDLYRQLNDSIQTSQYLVKIGQYQIKSKFEQGYRSPNFGKRFKARSYEKGTVVNAIGFGVSEKGYPRLKLDDGNFVTSNKKFIEYKGE